MAFASHSYMSSFPTVEHFPSVSCCCFGPTKNWISCFPTLNIVPRVKHFSSFSCWFWPTSKSNSQRSYSPMSITFPFFSCCWFGPTSKSNSQRSYSPMSITFPFFSCCWFVHTLQVKFSEVIAPHVDHLSFFLMCPPPSQIPRCRTSPCR